MTTVLAVLSLGGAACGAAGGIQSVPIEADKAFRLRLGESAQAGNAGMRVGFSGVSADSRCPKGEQCVWAGDATVHVWLQRGDGPREPRELHTATGAARGGAPPDADLRLVRLDPVPVAGTALAERDYVVTLMLTGGPAAMPDR